MDDFTCLSLSTDYRYLATVRNGDRKFDGVYIVDVETGAVLDRVPGSEIPKDCTFLPDGRLAFLSSAGLSLYNPDTSELWVSRNLTNDRYQRLFLADNKQFYIAGLFGLYRYDPSGETVQQIGTKPQGLAVDRIFSFNEELLIDGVIPGGTLVFETVRGDAVTPLTISSQLSILSIPTSPTSAVTSDDSGLYYIDPSGRTTLRQARGKDWFSSFDWAPDGRNIVATDRHHVERFRLEAPDDRCTLDLANVERVKFQASGASFVASTTDGYLAVVRTSDCHEMFRIAMLMDSVQSVSISDRVLLVNSGTGLVEWSLDTMTPTRTMHVDHYIESIALDERDRWFALLHDCSYTTNRLLLLQSGSTTTSSVPVNGTCDGPANMFATKTKVHVSTPTWAGWFDDAGTQTLWSDSRHLSSSEAVNGPFAVDGNRLVWLSESGDRTEWPDRPVAVGTSVDLARAVSWDPSNGLRVRDPRSGNVIRHIPFETREGVFQIRVASNQVWMLVGHDDPSKPYVELRGGPIDGSAWSSVISDSGIASFELSPNGRWLAVRNQLGFLYVMDTATRAMTELAGFQDGSWVSLRSDGTYDRSAGLAERVLVTEKDGRRRQLEASADGVIGTVRSTPYGGGALVKARLRSAGGPPTVQLGSMPIKAIKANSHFADVYDVSVFVDNQSRNSLSLTMTDKQGAEIPQTSAGTSQTRVLAIGNEHYAPASGLVDATGAADDAAGIAQLLRRPDSWATSQITLSRDLKQQALRDAVYNFLMTASPDQALFLYYAGHADNGQLLPTDFDRARGNGLDAKELVDWMTRSPARQVIVMLDACHGGRFVTPQLQSTFLLRALYSTTSANGSALSGTGSFTATMLRDLPTNPKVSFSLLQAFHATAGKLGLNPTIFDDSPIGTVPILYPKLAPASQAGSRPGSAIQITGFEVADTRGVVTNQLDVYKEQIVLRLRLTQTADALSLYVTDASGKETKIQAAKSPESGSLSRGSEVSWQVPIGELRPGPYRVEVWPCIKGNCNTGTPATAEFAKQ